MGKVFVTSQDKAAYTYESIRDYKFHQLYLATHSSTKRPSGPHSACSA